MSLRSPAEELARSLQLTIIVVAAGMLCLPLLAPHDRIGDGSEYYAMYLAWKLTHRPLVTPGLREAYEALIAHGYVNNLWPFDDLINAFPNLTIGQERDFNHFSFYSLLAAAIGSLLPGSFGADPTYAFYLLHYALIVAAAGLGYHLFRLPGVTAVMALFAASPALWYANKVHTEFFTIALSTIAVLAILDRRLIWATLAFAMAGTQNPSFAIVAAVTGLTWIVDKREPSTKADTVVAVLSGVICVLHPLYYWSRHGGFSPQVFGHGTSGDPLALLYMPVWLIDPDVGLLPYWPLGLLLIVTSFFAHRQFNFRGGWLAAGLIGFYLLVSLFAASQTSNLNSGGTIGVARYSTWLLCCFIPSLIVFARAISFRPLFWKSAAYGLGAMMMIYAMVKFRPEAAEDYKHATPVSIFVQTYVSRLYRPPTEIFVERYANEDLVDANVAVVVGPDCSRAAFLVRNLHVGTVESRYCEIGLDPEKLLALISNRLYARDGQKWQYTRLSAADVEAVRLRPSSSYDAKDKSLRLLLRSGWGRLEDWGVWSDGTEAVLALPISRADYPTGARITLYTDAFVPQDVRQTVTPLVNGKALGVWRYDAQSKDQFREIVISPEDMPGKDPTVIRFDIPTAVSPRAFGASDARVLGLAVSKVSIAAR
jgi:hypothetical protein